MLYRQCKDVDAIHAMFFDLGAHKLHLDYRYSSKLELYRAASMNYKHISGPDVLLANSCADMLK